MPHRRPHSRTVREGSRDSRALLFVLGLSPWAATLGKLRVADYSSTRRLADSILGTLQPDGPGLS